MERKRPDRVPERSVGLVLLGPAIDQQQVVPGPARRQRRQPRGAEAQLELVSGAHDHVAVIYPIQQFAHCTEARVPAGRRIPIGRGRHLLVVEPFRLGATVRNIVAREASEAQVGSASLQRGDSRFGGGRLDADKRSVPIDAHVGHQPDLAGIRREPAAQVDRDCTQGAAGQADISDRGDPFAALVLHLQERRLNHRRFALRRCHDAAGRRPVDPALEEQHGVLGIEVREL